MRLLGYAPSRSSKRKPFVSVIDMAVKVVTVVKVDGTLQWRCFRASGGNWVAVCDPLRLTVQAETWANLMEDIGHTVNAMFVDLLRSNELEEFLRDHNWRLVGQMPTQPSRVRFDMPFLPKLADRDKQVTLR